MSAITRREAGYLFESYNNVSTDLVEKFLDYIFALPTSADLNDYMKLDGSSVMSGDLEIGGNNIDNVLQVLFGTGGLHSIVRSGNTLVLQAPEIMVGFDPTKKVGFFGDTGASRQDVSAISFTPSIDPSVTELQTVVGDLRTALGASGYGLIKVI